VGKVGAVSRRAGALLSRVELLSEGLGTKEESQPAWPCGEGLRASSSKGLLLRREGGRDLSIQGHLKTGGWGAVVDHA
jgi:hypothetical protein